MKRIYLYPAEGKFLPNKMSAADALKAGVGGNYVITDNYKGKEHNSLRIDFEYYKLVFVLHLFFSS